MPNGGQASQPNAAATHADDAQVYRLDRAVVPTGFRFVEGSEEAAETPEVGFIPQTKNRRIIAPPDAGMAPAKLAFAVPGDANGDPAVGSGELQFRAAGAAPDATDEIRPLTTNPTLTFSQGVAARPASPESEGVKFRAAGEVDSSSKPAVASGPQSVKAPQLNVARTVNEPARPLLSEPVSVAGAARPAAVAKPAAIQDAAEALPAGSAALAAGAPAVQRSPVESTPAQRVVAPKRAASQVASKLLVQPAVEPARPAQPSEVAQNVPRQNAQLPIAAGSAAPAKPEVKSQVAAARPVARPTAPAVGKPGAVVASLPPVNRGDSKLAASGAVEHDVASLRPESPLPLAAPAAAHPLPSVTASTMAPLATAEQPIPPTNLPWIGNIDRQAEMEAVGRRAQQLVKQGFRLAERGAIFSARTNFIDAMVMVARARDVELQTTAHSQALEAGWLAIEEARDFVDTTGGSTKRLDLPRIVSVHRTQVLKHENLDVYSPVVAQQLYFSHAQELFANASGGEVACSLALYGLGKTATQMQSPRSTGSMVVLGEQVACFQASLMVDRNNFLAANELGVVLAENGRLDEARDLFLRSLNVTEQAPIWHNLAAVYGRLGETALASEASCHADHLQKTKPRPALGNNLVWVDPATFAQTTRVGEDLIAPPKPGAAPTAAPAPPAATAAKPAPKAKKQLASWPWKREPQR